LIDHWTRHRLQVSSAEAIAVAALASIQAIAYVGAVFMNAFEKIRIQVVLAGVSIALMIPLTFALMDNGYGIAAVPLSAMILTLPPAIACNRIAMKLVSGLRGPVTSA
jgi:hypothetical protein